MKSPDSGDGGDGEAVHGRGDVLRGALLMAAAAACYAILHGSVRYVSSDIHPFEITFFRNLFGFLVVLPWFVHGLQPLRTRRFGLHLLRAAGSGATASLVSTRRVQKLAPSGRIASLKS